MKHAHQSPSVESFSQNQSPYFSNEPRAHITVTLSSRRLCFTTDNSAKHWAAHTTTSSSRSDQQSSDLHATTVASVTPPRWCPPRANSTWGTGPAGFRCRVRLSGLHRVRGRLSFAAYWTRRSHRLDSSTARTCRYPPNYGPVLHVYWL